MQYIKLLILAFIQLSALKVSTDNINGLPYIKLPAYQPVETTLHSFINDLGETVAIFNDTNCKLLVIQNCIIKETKENTQLIDIVISSADVTQIMIRNCIEGVYFNADIRAQSSIIPRPCIEFSCNSYKLGSAIFLKHNKRLSLFCNNPSCVINIKSSEFLTNFIQEFQLHDYNAQMLLSMIVNAIIINQIMNLDSNSALGHDFDQLSKLDKNNFLHYTNFDIYQTFISQPCDKNNLELTQNLIKKTLKLLDFSNIFFKRSCYMIEQSTTLLQKDLFDSGVFRIIKIKKRVKSKDVVNAVDEVSSSKGVFSCFCGF